MPQLISEYSGTDLEAMSFAENYNRWILACFLPYLGNSVAEVGAGTGNFSTLLLETSIKELISFEPSRNMFSFLKDKLRSESKVKSVNSFLNCSEFRNYFDSVLYVNVLEHIKEDAAELKTVYTSLRDNGTLLIFVPGLAWLYSDFDRDVGHVRRYSKRQLVELVSGAGFSVVDVRYFDFVGILPWYINCVLLKRAINPREVALYDKYAVPVSRFFEGLFVPPIGKNILLVARKVHP